MIGFVSFLEGNWHLVCYTTYLKQWSMTFDTLPKVQVVKNYDSCCLTDVAVGDLDGMGDSGDTTY